MLSPYFRSKSSTTFFKNQSYDETANQTTKVLLQIQEFAAIFPPTSLFQKWDFFFTTFQELESGSCHAQFLIQKFAANPHTSQLLPKNGKAKNSSTFAIFHVVQKNKKERNKHILTRELQLIHHHNVVTVICECEIIFQSLTRAQF